MSNNPNILAFGQVLQAASKPTIQQLHPDVELDLFGPPEIPFIRHARGVDEFRRAVTHNFAALADQQSEFLSLVAQGNIIVIVGREPGRLRESGMPYDVHFSYEFTFRDGKVVHARQVAAATEVQRRFLSQQATAH